MEKIIQKVFTLYLSQYTSSTLDFLTLGRHYNSKAPTDLRSIERSFFMKNTEAQTFCSFNLVVKSGSSKPVLL